MENYAQGANAVLSNPDIATTDTLVLSAIESTPKSAVAGIMPVIKAKGPSVRWVEPIYKEDKIVMKGREIYMDDEKSRMRLEFSFTAADDLRHLYSPDAFKNIIQNWVLWFKHQRQMEQLLEILNSPAVASLPYSAQGALTLSITDDNVELLKTQIMVAITSLMKAFQFSDMDYSIVAPFEIAFIALELQAKIPGKIHFMGCDEVKDIYVFPTGTTNSSRAGFALFDYADTAQLTHDPQTGEEIYFIFSRSRVALNPIHEDSPVIRKIELN